MECVFSKWQFLLNSTLLNQACFFSTLRKMDTDIIAEVIFLPTIL